MEWLQILGPSLLVILGGLITWFVKSKTEELLATEKKLLDERRKIYEKILEPYIQLFSDLKNSDDAMKKIVSFDYKKTSFDLYLFGSDSVVKAYNQLMQCAFKNEALKTQDPRTYMTLWANFFLEIRKSLGNKRTKLSNIDMLKGWIKDIDKIISN